MRRGASKRTVAILVGALLLAGLLLAIFSTERGPEPTVEIEDAEEQATPVATTLTIGYSVEGRPIEVYQYGTGGRHILFVGGIHGGYEWNSVYLAYRVIDHLEAHPELVPEDVTVSIIPSANPDGLFDVVGSGGRFALAAAPDFNDGTGLGRFNANGVDLNRNFDCKWQSESVWRGNAVSPGPAPFSEPESMALRDYIVEQQPAAVVFWHSQGNAVYGSECESGVLPETLIVMNTYANAAGYPAIPAFTAYPVTGDAEGWLASIGIPAITVELSTHETTDWEKNIAGIQALLTSMLAE